MVGLGFCLGSGLFRFQLVCLILGQRVVLTAGDILELSVEALVSGAEVDA